MNETKYNQTQIVIPWYIELYDGVHMLNRHSQAYSYYLGHKLEYNTTEEEAYQKVYGMTKEEHEKIYGIHGSSKFLEAAKKERIKLLFDVIRPEVKADWEKALQEKQDTFAVDPTGLELVLALHYGAPFKDVKRILEYYGDSGFATTWYLGYINEVSERGTDFINYLSENKDYQIYTSKVKTRK